MRRVGLILVAVSIAACVVKPTEPDAAAFACDVSEDCATDYVCQAVGPDGPRFCVRDVVCGPGDCPPGFTCSGEPARCWPPGVAVGPCAGKPCAGEDVCVDDPTQGTGYRCAPCTDEKCPAGGVCVEVSPATWGCRPSCPAVGAMCEIDGQPGKCAEVSAHVNQPSPTVEPAKACAPCPPGCGTTESCRLTPGTPTGAPAWHEATFCFCTTDENCPTGERCVLYDDTDHRCLPECSPEYAPCTLSADPGWCTSILAASGTYAQVCVRCERACHAPAVCEIITSVPEHLSTTVQACSCEQSSCAAQQANHDCGPAVPPPGTDCLLICANENDCPGTEPACPSGFCVPVACDHDTQVDGELGEICDDGEPMVGPCRGDCAGPECDWGLVFGGATGPNNVVFAQKPAHDMGVQYTIELWLRLDADGATPMPILRKRGPNATDPGYRITWVNSQLVAEISDESNTATVTSDTLSLGQVYRVMLVRNGSQVHWYVDDASSGSPTTTAPAAALPNTFPLTLGATGTERVAAFAVDALRLWSADRTGTTVPRCQHSQESGLVGEWLFNYTRQATLGEVIDTSATAATLQAAAGQVAGGMVR